MGYFERIGSRVFVPVATLLFIAGVAMTLQAWSFGKTWIALAVVLWILSAVAGAIYLGPRAKRVGELFDAEGPTSEAGRALTNRIYFLVSRLELLQFRDRDRPYGVQARVVRQVVSPSGA